MWEFVSMAAVYVAVAAFIALELASGFYGIPYRTGRSSDERDCSVGYKRGGDSVKFVCACIGDEDVGDYNFAVIEMSKDYIEWLCGKLDAAKALRKEYTCFYAMQYFDYWVEYYTALPSDVDPVGGNFIRVADDFMLDQEPLPVAARTVVIMVDGIMWTGHPKHSGGQFQTPVMQESFLRDLREEN